MTAALLSQPSEAAPDWPTSPPAEQGLDASALDRLAEQIRAGKRFPDLHSLLIVRNGHLVVEEYFGGYHKDRLHALQSVSKSFTSALVGIAIGRGELKGVDERVLDFFPGREIHNRDSRKESMTLEDLLTMRSGTDYHEGYSGSPHSQLNGRARGWGQFVLDRPMVRRPGSAFQYDSGAVILMSSILKSRVGVHADGYAEEHLFKPLGITRHDWFRNQEGHPHTGGGLDLTPRDMAKFGLLYLRGGRWGDRQVVPAEWVKASTSLQVEFKPRRGKSIGYGYWWWILPPDPDGAGKELIYAAMGFRAQYIFVVPERDMVVVVTGGTGNSADQRTPIEFLYSHVLKAVVR